MSWVRGLGEEIQLYISFIAVLSVCAKLHISLLDFIKNYFGEMHPLDRRQTLQPSHACTEG